MKHKGNQFQYQDQFTHDLLMTYKRVRKMHLQRYGRISRPLLNMAIANSPAQRFYTSEEQATRIIRGMLTGRTYPKMLPLKREMYLEILSRVKARIRSRQKQIEPLPPIQPIVELILSEPAPKFYISPQSIDSFICRHRSELRKLPPAR